MTQKAHLKTAELLAQESGVAPTTIRRDAEFAEDVDTLTGKCGEPARRAILAQETPLTRKDVKELATKKPAQQKQIMQRVIQKGTKPQPRRIAPPRSTITVPIAPKALAKALVEQWGFEEAAKVSEALFAELKPLESIADDPKRSFQQNEKPERRRCQMANAK